MGKWETSRRWRKHLFRQNLRKLFRASGLSRQKAADLCGMEYPLFCRWLQHGIERATPRTQKALDGLCTFFKVPPEALWSEATETPAEYGQKVIEIFEAAQGSTWRPVEALRRTINELTPVVAAARQLVKERPDLVPPDQEAFPYLCEAAWNCREVVEKRESPSIYSPAEMIYGMVVRVYQPVRPEPVAPAEVPPLPENAVEVVTWLKEHEPELYAEACGVAGGPANAEFGLDELRERFGSWEKVLVLLRNLKNVDNEEEEEPDEE